MYSCRMTILGFLGFLKHNIDYIAKRSPTDFKYITYFDSKICSPASCSTQQIMKRLTCTYSAQRCTCECFTIPFSQVLKSSPKYLETHKQWLLSSTNTYQKRFADSSKQRRVYIFLQRLSFQKRKRTSSKGGQSSASTSHHIRQCTGRQPEFS